VRFALASLAVLWLASILIAPRVLSSSHRALAAGAACVYLTGGFVCHQRPERSFRLAGRQMPVCARCTGLYAAAAVAAPIALLAASAFGAARARRIALVAALPTIVTWSIEHFGFVQLSNMTRFVAALPLGFAVAWLIMSEVRGARFEDRSGAARQS
jgi:uncharacterized membrane protein